METVPSDKKLIQTPYLTLGSVHSYAIHPKIKNSFIHHLIDLEYAKNDKRDYRFGVDMGRGNGKVHDIVDPSFNCLENSWIATEFSINNSKVTINGNINNIDKKAFPEL